MSTDAVDPFWSELKPLCDDVAGFIFTVPAPNAVRVQLAALTAAHFFGVAARAMDVGPPSDANADTVMRAIVSIFKERGQ